MLFCKKNDFAKVVDFFRFGEELKFYLTFER